MAEDLMWFILPIAFVVVAAMVGGAIASRISENKRRKRNQKWKAERIKMSPMCRDETCESDEHCGLHHCHCDREMTVNCYCQMCGCPYWVPGM